MLGRAGTMSQVLLKGTHITKRFGQGEKENTVLDDVSVDIYEGDFTIIMGSSGAGKSTLLNALSGMDKVSEGTVAYTPPGTPQYTPCRQVDAVRPTRYKEQEINSLKEKQMARLRANEFGFVFQQTHLVSNLSLFENIAVAGYMGEGQTEKQVRKRAEALLRQMHIEKAKDRYPSEVSGGEAQRAAIARAVVNEPGIVFADEPTGALNKSNTEDVLDLLTMLNQKGQSILMVTHDIHAAARGNRILYLEDGKVLAQKILLPYEKSNERDRETEIHLWLDSLKW